MPISVGHIVDALASLGGEAHLDKIVARVIQIAPEPHPVSPGASIRARIQERCAETESYKGREDLFQSVYGVDARRGFWRLRADPLAPSNSDGVLDGADAFLEAEEGRATLRIHLRRERSRRLIEAFKKSLTSTACEACGIDLQEVYGDLAKGYIEAHHKVPVAMLDDHTKTKLSDLAALCPNCHRIVHRNGIMPVAELAAHLARRKSLKTR